LWGFIRLYEKTGEEKYRQYVIDYCEKHVHENGNLHAFKGDSLDDIMAGSVLVWAWQNTKQEKYKIACGHVRRAFDDYPRNPDGGFWHSRNLHGQMWVDGVFMGLMFLVRYGAFIDDRDYCFNEAVHQLSVVFDRCEKDDSGLLYHAYCENSRAAWANPITGKSQEIWCEGLGWYAMILADVLEILPRGHEGYDRLSMQMRKLVNGLEKVQDKASGLWYQVVDKPSHPRNWHDTCGSAMFLYAIKKAGILGITGQEQNERITAKAFAGLKTKCQVDLEGNANIYDACDGLCVQLNYDIYTGYAKNVNAKEAVAAFLWACQIMEYSNL
jgi:unsaturated rhamnogalacturonyl hydrolase